jgi:hypothetical protein
MGHTLPDVGLVVAILATTEVSKGALDDLLGSVRRFTVRFQGAVLLPEAGGATPARRATPSRMGSSARVRVRIIIPTKSDRNVAAAVGTMMDPCLGLIARGGKGGGRGGVNSKAAAFRQKKVPFLYAALSLPLTRQGRGGHRSQFTSRGSKPR